MQQAIFFTNCSPQLILPLKTEPRSRSLTLNSREGKLIENIIRQGLQWSDINKSDHILQRSANLPKYPTLSTLNEIAIDDSYDNLVDRQKQNDPDKESIASFSTVYSNFVTVGHSTKIPGYITAPLPINKENQKSHDIE